MAQPPSPSGLQRQQRSSSRLREPSRRGQISLLPVAACTVSGSAWRTAAARTDSRPIERSTAGKGGSSRRSRSSQTL